MNHAHDVNPYIDAAVAYSPLAVYRAHLARGQLAYQVDEDGHAVFFPRLIAPRSGGRLSWRISDGHGSVYSSTIIYRKGEAPLNVSLIDLDEGFRMMSRVENIAPEAVHIGMRVVFRVARDGEGQPCPVFVPAEQP